MQGKRKGKTIDSTEGRAVQQKEAEGQKSFEGSQTSSTSSEAEGPQQHKYSSASTIEQEEVVEATDQLKAKWLIGGKHIGEYEVSPSDTVIHRSTSSPPIYLPIELFRSVSPASTVEHQLEVPIFPFLAEVQREHLSNENIYIVEREFEAEFRPQHQMVSNNFPQSMEEEHSRYYAHRGVSGICGVPARLSGLVSFAIQTCTLVLSCLLVGLLFVHAGGYRYFTGGPINDEPFVLLNSSDMETATTKKFPSAQPLISPKINNETTDLEAENALGQLLRDPENDTMIDGLLGENGTFLGDLENGTASNGTLEEVEAVLAKEENEVDEEEDD